jgi:hypothetical protein
VNVFCFGIDAYVFVQILLAFVLVCFLNEEWDEAQGFSLIRKFSQSNPNRAITIKLKKKGDTNEHDQCLKKRMSEWANCAINSFCFCIVLDFPCESV